MTSIHPDAAIGHDVRIGSRVTISADVVIGDRVEIADGVFIDDGVTIESDVCIGANTTFATTLNPQPGITRKPMPIVVRQGASIGSNATIIGGAVIGKNAFVGHGAVVRSAVPVSSVVEGNPAVIVGYVNSERRRANDDKAPRPSSTFTAANVGDVSIHRMPLIHDLRGNLSVGGFGSNVPFDPKRYFLVFDVPNTEVRGEHAHRECHQFLICLRGEISVVVDDGYGTRAEYRLTDPTTGIYLPPMIWGIQYQQTADAMLLVFASHEYDPADYIRDYDEFLVEAAESRLAGSSAGSR